MKKKLQQLLVLLAVTAGTAKAQGTLTIVKGHANIDKALGMILWQANNGERLEIASAKLNSNSDFAFALPANTEGYYYLSDNYKRQLFTIYLKPGDQLELTLEKDSYTLDKGSAENKLLYEWFKLYNPVQRMSGFPRSDTATFHSFFPKLTALLPAAETFKKKINSPNKNFNALLKWTVDFEIEKAALGFLLTPNTVHPTKEQYPAFYKTIIQPTKFCDGMLLKTGDAVMAMGRYVTFNSLMTMSPNKTRPENSLLANASLICNDTLKGLLISNSLGGYKSYDEMVKMVEPVRKYLVTDSMEARYFRALKNLSSMKKGSPSYQFTYPDNSGKNVSMASLKGKVVLVDVWATWCGPCKAEIPSLKKLEEEMHNQNVAFVSISVDDIKDKEKWKNFIQAESLSGIQLYASTPNDFSKYYDVKTIPRFLVFDQDGKIVTVDAPRPSTPELKKLLQSLLTNGGQTTSLTPSN